MRLGSLLFVLTLLLLVQTDFRGAQRLQPFTLTVCPQGPPACQFATIQEAIQAAASDDILLIQPGTYAENLTLNKSLSLIATEIGQVRVQGVQPQQATLTLETQEEFRVTLAGLTILGRRPLEQGEFSCRRNPDLCTDGIYVTGQGSLVLNLVNVQITRAGSDGLTCKSGQSFSGAAYVFVSNSSFIANGGSGIAIVRCQFPELILYLEQVEFSGNFIGLDFADSSPSKTKATISIENSRFVGNIGGFSFFNVSQSQIFIANSLFLQNTAGGGIHFMNKSSLEVRNSQFVGNKIGLQFASDAPQEDSSIRIENSSFLGNSLFGLEIQSPNRLTIQGNSIEGNGSGLWIELANNFLEISRNTIRRNREFGIALHRYPCKPDLPPTLTFPTFIQGQDNVIRENVKGNLCPEDYNWPPNFRKP